MITQRHVEEAQQLWRKALLALGTCAHLDFSQRYERAQRTLGELYDFAVGPLFKPTLARGTSTFRLNEGGVLAYFIQDRGDAGFALKGWQDVKFENAQILCFSSYAVAMGHYHFRDDELNTTTVEYTFTYREKKEHEPVVKIIAHHSSIPYSGIHTV